MSQDTQPGELPRVRTLVEWKLPLPWLLGGIGAFAITAMGLYYQVGTLIETQKDMKEQFKALQIAVNSGNTQATTLAGQIEILKFRIEALESDKRSAK